MMVRHKSPINMRRVGALRHLHATPRQPLNPFLPLAASALPAA